MANLAGASGSNQVIGKRLFISVDLPEAVGEFLEDLDPQVSGVRWLDSEQMHLTLSFLGEVAADPQEELQQALAVIRFGAFFLPVAGMGVFPRKGNPRVVWAGVGAGHPHLFQLHKRVQEAALAAGLEPDLRPWHPHITVARCRDVPGETIRPFLKKNEGLDAGMIRVEEFHLYSSRLAPAGSIHTRELTVVAS